MIDRETALHIIAVVSHLLVLWGGIALYILCSALWLRRYQRPTTGQLLLWVVLSLCAAFVWLTLFGVLPVAANGRLESPGLGASLRQTVSFFWPGTGWAAAVLLILSGCKWIIARLR